MKLKTVKQYGTLADCRKIEALKKWVQEELERNVEQALRITMLDPHATDFEELLQYSLEDLPLEIHNWDEGSPHEAIIKYRLRHGIEPEDCQDWEYIEWPEFVETAVRWIDTYQYDPTEDLTDIQDVRHNLINLHEIATILGDEELHTNVARWQISLR